MELLYNLLEGRHSAWHGSDEIELVAVVNADVRVGGPDQDFVHAAVAGEGVIEIGLDAESVCFDVVECLIVRVLATDSCVNHLKQ